MVTILKPNCNILITPKYYQLTKLKPGCYIFTVSKDSSSHILYRAEVLKIIITGFNSSSTNEIEDALTSYISDIHISMLNMDDRLPSVINQNCYPDALIINIRSYDMSTIKLIKQIREYSDMPIIIVSKDKNIRLLVKYLDAGADDFITTPFNKNIFASSVQALVRRVNWDTQKTN